MPSGQAEPGHLSSNLHREREPVDISGERHVVVVNVLTADRQRSQRFVRVRTCTATSAAGGASPRRSASMNVAVSRSSAPLSGRSGCRPVMT
ncbi:MAG: hypothetical protein R2705_05565 [Ilumatobacteraceae bacterium]